MRNKKIIFLSISFIFFLIVIVVVVLLFLSNSSIPRSNPEDQVVSYPQDQIISAPKVGENKNYNGQFINAEIPISWDIKEYNNNDGMFANAMANYTGMTGFEILNNNIIIFSFKGVDGVGGNGACKNLYKFNDTQQSFLQRIIDSYREMQTIQDPPPDEIKDPILLNFSNENYTSITLFGRESRRIGTDLYWKSDDSPMGSFNPECGLSSEILKFDKPQFYVVSKDSNDKIIYTESTYSIKIVSNFTNENELKILDKVINSIVLK